MAKNTNNDTNKDNDVLVAIYGNNTFLKVYQAIEIGKIKFSFVNKDNPNDSIDCYLDCDIFNCDLIDKITSKDCNGLTPLEKLAIAEKQFYAEKKANARGQSVYHSPIWVSPSGVNNGNIVRKFEIQPADKTDYVFRATEGKKNILVGCEARFLTLLAERWKYLKVDYDVYMRQKYNKEAMKNPYHSQKMENVTPTQYAVDDENENYEKTSSTANLSASTSQTQQNKPTTASNATAKADEPVKKSLTFTNKDIASALTLCTNSTTKYAMKLKDNTVILFEKEHYEGCKEWSDIMVSLQDNNINSKISIEVEVKDKGYLYFRKLISLKHEEQIRIKTTGKLLEKDNSFVVNSLCGEKNIEVVFETSHISECDMWEKLKERLTKSVGVGVSMKVFNEGNKAYFIALPSAS